MIYNICIIVHNNVNWSYLSSYGNKTVSQAVEISTV